MPDSTAPDDYHFYEPALGHGLPHDPFNAMVGPRPIGWISSHDGEGRLNLAPSVQPFCCAACRAAMRSSIGGWVENSLPMLPAMPWPPCFWAFRPGVHIVLLANRKNHNR